MKILALELGKFNSVILNVMVRAVAELIRNLVLRTSVRHDERFSASSAASCSRIRPRWENFLSKQHNGQ
jgi:hypothetical protein